VVAQLRDEGGVAGKAGYVLSCALASLVLLAAGVGYYAQTRAEITGSSAVLAGGPSTGSMNILVMGLESRTYWNGRPLPRPLEDIMHIGETGGNATNTLILVHIFSGGQKAIGFSIPRDSYVHMYGTMGFGPTMSKIDNAYGYAMAAKVGQIARTDPGMPAWQQQFEGNEAGRLATVQTVEALTGQTINKIAELNLDGYYELARQFGGVEVCVRRWRGGSNLTDANSGADLQPGYQHLNAAQALSFVRERDNLPAGDLDRTARQQAVLDYALWKLKTDGLLRDVGQLNSLLSFASNYMITSKGWNLLQFAGEMDALSGQNLTFHTAPVIGPRTVPGIGDVEAVNSGAIQAEVTRAFRQAPGSSSPPGKGGGIQGNAGVPPSRKLARLPAIAEPAHSSVTVDVYNAGQTSGLAGQTSQALADKGYLAGVVATAAGQQPLTTVSFGTGASVSATLIARDFGVAAVPSGLVRAGHVKVILGGEALGLPQSLGGPAPSSSIPPGQVNTEGGTVGVPANARYGIPCVY
jgi:LCP family protein required for cell wall assembly